MSKISRKELTGKVVHILERELGEAHKEARRGWFGLVQNGNGLFQ